MEILARNLESESSPRKKVDLFFLVDSITQCSGGMKGKSFLSVLRYYCAYIPLVM